ncbi:type I-F CRISPR-associated helicase Cas3 [Endozoicomonas sp. SM1973]|uniref:Type I-F CRISPR-associated helicase Cas3 n=1 Tax=Spartinivicinus marinus TaxID=2994442 RepID=A0A853I578_9GAMM|nr:type I-F CRISPR-associated helicase Cas3f [Spartinivicinus marinus]NYZ67859.1 type I-F CRISPR-associated helicase Cas3 [Spartinivicinus marinus]
MIVIFVSECEHKALKRTRKILNQYANQIGQRTWLTHMSEEGLQHIHSLLRQASSRHMAVACHRVLGRTRTALLWVVGSRKHFNADGIFAFSTTQQDVLNIPKQASPMQRLCAYLSELAGFFHDIGKDNAFFQEKLQAAIQGNQQRITDPVRHELLSTVLVKALVKKVCQVKTWPKNDESWVNALSNKQQLSAYFSQLVEDGGWLVDIDQSHESPLPLPIKTLQAPLLWAWLWLIVSHHRVPFGKYKDSQSNKIILTCKNHVNGSSSEQENDKDDLHNNLRPADTEQRFWEQDQQWLKGVAHCIQKIQHWLTNHQALLQDPQWQQTFLTTIIHYSRTGMMCADHAVSAKDNRGDNLESNSPLSLLANTAKGKETSPGALLGNHLFNVGKQASSMTRSLWQPNLSLPAIEKTDLPAPLRSQPCEPKHSVYAWQDSACNAVKSVNKAGENAGFIGLVQAGTGYGKTRGCARIMATISPELRYTVIIGLRSLTLQTGQVYRKELELASAQLTVLVGESFIKRLMKYEESCAQGSESLAAENEEGLMVDGDPDVHLLPQALSILLDKKIKQQKLLASPVVVCTADYLAAAADARRGSHLIAMLRLLSADLVIDEVDNFDETALVVLGKLVYLSGLAGRRVLLSSATLSPSIASAMFSAYRAGYLHYCHRLEITKPQVAVGWFSHLSTLCKTHWINDDDDHKALKKFNTIHAKHSQKLITHMDQQPAKRKVEWLKVPDNFTLPMLPNLLYQAAQTLHQRFAQTDPKTGKKLSIGLIRVSHVSSCWYLSSQLTDVNSGSGWEHQVVCYHARLPGLARMHTEKWLDQALHRKKPDALWDEPLIRQLLDNTEAEQVLIMVVATGVEEVGRDHDFDWGILEPSSTRSVVQCGGRILRHRDLLITESNIILLPTVIQYWLNPTGSVVYQNPGVETKKHYELSTKQAEALYPKSWQEKLDARYNLAIPSSSEAEITALEHQRQYDYLHTTSNARTCDQDLKKAEGYNLVDWCNDPLLAANDRHSKGNPFRQHRNKILYWCDNQDDWWQIIVKTSGKQQGNPVSANSAINLKMNVNENRLLLQQLFSSAQIEDEYQSLKSLLYQDNDDDYTRQMLLGFEFENNGQTLLQISYHFWLGATKKHNGWE